MKKINKGNMSFPKLCVVCKKVRLKRGRAIYCGSYLRKTGCSYIKHKERVNKGWKKWRARYPDRAKYHQKRQDKRKKLREVRS